MGSREARQLRVPDPRPLDLADLARSKRDSATRRCPHGARPSPDPALRGDLVAAVVARRPAVRRLARRAPLGGPNNGQQRKHWIGVTPMEAELTVDRERCPAWRRRRTATRPSRSARPCASAASVPSTSGCSTPGAAAGRTARASARSSGSTPRSRRSARATTAGSAPVSSALHRRRGRAHVRPAVHGRHAGRAARLAAGDPALARLRPRRAERRQDHRCWSCRAMFVQAWGHYGTVWPVVHQQLGVRPDLGRGRLEIVRRSRRRHRSRARTSGSARERCGGSSRRGRGTCTGRRSIPATRGSSGCTSATLTGARGWRKVRLDGRRTRYQVRQTNRGEEVVVKTRRGHHRWRSPPLRDRATAG